MHIFTSICRTAFKSLILSSSLLVISLIVQGQNWTQYDQGTPPQHAAGVSPIGSYVSADLGMINLSNGALSLSLPMGSSGGRGFTLPISLNYSSKVWSLAHETVYDPVHQIDKAAVYASYGAEGTYSDVYQRLAPGWTISGVPTLKVQHVPINPCSSNGVALYHVTKVSVMLPDRGEIELRDDQSDGAPLYVGCVAGTSLYRGRRWHATNGSGMIFVSDNDNGIMTGDFQGTLVSAEGMRYHFINSIGFGGAFARCDMITDRNGNQISISYSFDLATGHLETDYVDQLGRTTKVEENAADPSNSSIILPLLVTLKGYQNTTQYYKVKTDLLSNHIRADFGYNNQPIVTGSHDRFGYCYQGGQPPPQNYLFPTSYCENQERIDNQKQVSQVILPDGRSLQFAYNLFGELAEVVLPTGGKLQYDYSGFTFGLPAGNTKSMEWQTAVNQITGSDRAVIGRRTYPNGTTLEGSWTYGYGPQSFNGSSYACTEVKAFNGTAAPETLLSYQRHFFLPSGRYLTGGVGTVVGTGYSLWSTGIEWRTETLNASAQVIAASEQDWSQRMAVSWSSGYAQEQPANDNRVSQTRGYLDNGSFARTETFYDNSDYPRANNVTEVKEYDYDGSLKRRSTTSYVTGSYQTDDSIHLVRLPLEQLVYASNGTTQKARTINEYDVYVADGNHYYQQDYGAVTGHSASFGVGKVTRGNLTAVGHWLNTNNTIIYSYLRYDILGNPVVNKDANGKLTTLSYADDFGEGSSPGGTTSGTYGATYALPTKITSPQPNSGENAHVAYSQYDFSTGLLTGFKDRNGVITQSIYNDPFNRPTQTKSGLNLSGFETHTAIYYAPTTTPFGITLDKNDVLIAKDQVTVDDKVLRAWIVTDGFGRTIESWMRDPSGDDKTKVLYDGVGRVKQKSNPYRPSQGEIAVYTTTAYDLAGRVTSVTKPDGAVVNTSYSANTATATDQTNKARKTVTNALGRLVQVYEDPAGLNYLTQYAYDELDNLTTVTQGTQPSRSFVYNSLKRLTSAFNPESGTTSYDYDNNGNLLHKTDARNITTTFSYDALNRPVSKTYNDSPQTPAVNYFYDSQTPTGAPSFSRGPSTGRLVAVTYGGSSTGDYLGYDAIGHAALKIQRTGTVDYLVTAIYNLAGAMTYETYPSNRTVSFGYDQAGRTLSVAGTLGDGGSTRNYSTGILYSALGGMTKEQFGTDTPIYNKLYYNVRGQLAEIRESTIAAGTDYNRGAIINNYGTQNNCWGASCNSSDNNGNLRRQENWIPDNESSSTSTQIFTQSYSYDKLNRLESVTESKYVNGSPTGTPTLAQTYIYDRFGNRTIDTRTGQTWGGVNNLGFEVQTTTNQLYSPGDLNLTTETSRRMQYDAAGNLKQDTYTGVGTRSYDAENRMTSAQGGINAGAQNYTYDGSGQRVRRKIDDVETWQVYGLGGELLAEYAADTPFSSPQKEYGYRNGQLLITAAPGSSSTPPTRTNVAQAANGGVATASSTLSSDYLPAKVIDGSRQIGSGPYSLWVDNTNGLFPDWVEVAFNGSKTIDEIDVITRPNDSDFLTEPTLTQTFTNNQGITQFVVEYWNGSAWISIPSGSVTGNNKVWRQFTFSGITTSKIRLWVTDSGDHRLSRVAEVEAWTAAATPTPTRSNLALSSNGGVVTASSTLSSDYLPAKLIDGSRQVGSGPYSLWVDNTNGLFPDWVEVAFNGSKTIDEIDVITRPNDSDFLTEPTLTQTFTNNQGITAFVVEYWNGSAWISIPSGSVTGNNKVWRQFTFSGITTSKIRLWVTDSGDHRLSRVAEVEAWGTPASSGSTTASASAAPAAEINWLVTDQLGTPRMVFDKTGSLANMKRHDYLPFGEELGAGMGQRTTVQGYTTDGIRQKFTRKERDIETGLDYFGARYYGSTQGRFTSVDPYNIVREAQITAEDDPHQAAAQLAKYLSSPQQWNRYAYVANNPLTYVDPTGELLELTGDIDAAFARIKNLAGDAANLLYTYTKNGHTYVDYHGSHSDAGQNINALVKADAAGINVYLAKVIGSTTKTIEFQVAESFDTKFRTGVQTGGADCGGACTVGAEESKTGNTQIFANKQASGIAEEEFNKTINRVKFTPGVGRVWAEDDVVDAHEFGHAFANAFEGKRVYKSNETYGRSVEFENHQRARYPDRRPIRRIIE